KGTKSPGVKKAKHELCYLLFFVSLFLQIRCAKSVHLSTTIRRTLEGFSLLKRFVFWFVVLGLLLTINVVGLHGQAPNAQSPPTNSGKSDNPGQAKESQSIPDAPSAVQPPQPAQENPQPATPETPLPQAPAPQLPQRNPTPPRESAPADHGQAPGTRPPVNIRIVPDGGATNERASAQDELFKIIVNTNQV